MFAIITDTVCRKVPTHTDTSDTHRSLNWDMVSKIQIESWILMHACKHRYHQVVKGVLSRYHDNIDELVVPHIYVSVAMIHDIVTSDNVLQYPVAIHHLSFIQSQVCNAVPFKVFSKLTMGLKMKFAMYLLERNHTDTLMVLNQYFPRTPSQYEGVSRGELSRLQSAKMNFRKFFLPLLAHSNQRAAYFSDEYEEEYGDRYLEALRQLATIFSESVNAHLPPSPIDKILSDGADHYLPLLEGSPCLPLEMLLDILQMKESVEEGDLLDLLTMISPLNTQDRVVVDKMNLLNSEDGDYTNSNRTNSKSLFSSESDKGVNRPDDSNSDEINRTDENLNHNHRPCENSENEVTNSVVIQEKENISPCTERKRQDSETRVDNFSDFNEKQHLYDKGRNSGNIVKESSNSAVSSGESVSILKTKHPKNPTKAVHTSGAYESDVEDEALERWIPSDMPREAHCIGDKSISDIDQMSEEDDFIPPSRMETVQLWDVFMVDGETDVENLPSILAHRKPSQLKLCVVKLYRNKSLDIYGVNKEKDVTYQMYS